MAGLVVVCKSILFDAIENHLDVVARAHIANSCAQTQRRIIQRGIDRWAGHVNNWRNTILKIDTAIDLVSSTWIGVLHLKSVESRA